MKSETITDLQTIGKMDTREVIKYHLKNNHYPPIPDLMVEPCIEALKALKIKDYNKSISLPDGVIYKGSKQATAEQIAEAHHLYDIIEANLSDF